MPVVTLRHTVVEYFEYDAASPARNEYFDGEIRELGGRTPNYNLLFSNLSRGLIGSFDNSQFTVCVKLPIVKVPQSSSYCCADLVVVRGSVQFEPERTATIRNPLVVFEILPECLWYPGPAERIALYQQVPTIEHGILISQNNIEVESFRRDAEVEWHRERMTNLADILKFPSLNWSLPIADLYEGFSKT